MGLDNADPSHSSARSFLRHDMKITGPNVDGTYIYKREITITLYFTLIGAHEYKKTGMNQQFWFKENKYQIKQSWLR